MKLIIFSKHSHFEQLQKSTPGSVNELFIVGKDINNLSNTSKPIIEFGTTSHKFLSTYSVDPAIVGTNKVVKLTIDNSNFVSLDGEDLMFTITKDPTWATAEVYIIIKGQLI